MKNKFHKYKSISELMSSNILFTAAYLLFSAEICTSSPKHKSRNGIGNGYIAIPQVEQKNKLEEVSDPAGDALPDDSRQSDPVLAINPAEDDPLLDTDTTTLFVEPLKQSVVQDKVKASPVVTTSSLEENKREEGSTKSADELRPSPIDSAVGPKRPKRRLRKSTARSSGTPNQISVNEPKPNLLHTPSNTNKLVISPILNSAVGPERPKRRRRKSILPVIVEKNSSNSTLSSNASSDGHTFVPPPPPPFPSQDNSPSSLNGVGDGNTYPSPPPPPPLPVVDNGRPPSNRVGDKSKPLNNIQEKERSKQPQDTRSDLLEAIRGGVDLRKVSEKERSKQPQDPRSELLEEIQRGVHLRKVEKKPKEKPLNTKEHSDVASILARRVAVELSDSDSGTESESENNNDEWKD